MSVSSNIFGYTEDGKSVKQFIIRDGKMSVSLIELGASIHELFVPDKNGECRDVVLGYDSVAGYEHSTTFFGATLGRLISRMPDCTLHFEGKDYPLENDEGMHMHGGVKGFSRVKWEGEITGDNQVTFTYISPDGEEGYPGEVTAKVIYSIVSNCLSIAYDWTADRRTVVNPSNHSYFNLNGHDHGSICDHTLSAPVTAHFNQLTEESCPLDDGADITKETQLGELFKLGKPSLEAMGGGLDHKFVLQPPSGDMKLASTLYSPASGIEMQCWTTMPCIMIYSGNMIKDIQGKAGTIYQKHAGICFETMLFSSLHDMLGGTAIVEPGKHHKSLTQFVFDIHE